MFDDLKEKIDDFVSSIKSKLPGSNSDDDDEYEDEDGEFEEKTEEINIAQKLSESEDDDEDEDDDDEDDEDEDEDAAKAKKQKFMRLGLVGVILVLGANILLDPAEEDTTVPEVKPIVRKNRPKRKKKVVKKEVVKEQVVEASVPDAIEEVPEPVVESPEPIEEQAEPRVEIIENTIELKDETPDIDPSSIIPLDQQEIEQANASSLGEGSVSQKNDGATGMSEALDNLNKSKASGMIQKVVREKLEYQEPPNYLETGRGLVYNCTGKHWACVDQTSFITCKQNSDWSTENNKDPECYPSNVYKSFKDCRTIQLYNINTNLETSFCTK